MKTMTLAGLALGLLTTAALAQADRLGIQSEPARDGTTAWHLGPCFPDPAGFTLVDPDGTVNVIPREERPRHCGAAPVPGGARRPPCSHSSSAAEGGPFARSALARVEWEQNMGYKFSYPYVVPKGIGGVPSVALDSKGNLWVFKRSPAGVVQLMKFDPDHKLILEVPESVIGHQDKAHGMAVDADDNVWITDNGQATVMKLSPEGKLLMTIGTKGHRGDWVEAKGQRLLWQPVMMAFAPNGDVYIAEGHANESPNDVDSDDPTNIDRRGARHPPDQGRQVRRPMVRQRGRAGQVRFHPWPGGRSHQRRCLDRRPRAVPHRRLYRRRQVPEDHLDDATWSAR